MRSLFLLPALVLLAACAGPLKAPPIRSAEGAFVTARLPSESEKGPGTSLPDSYFGVSGASGSAAAGLMLGPLGAFANAQYIASENQRRTERLAELTSQNLAKVLGSEVPGLGAAKGASSPTYELVPGAVLRFVSPTTYVLECSVTAWATAGERWIVRYTTAADPLFDAQQAEDTQKAIATLRPCLRTAHTLFTEHLADSLEPFQPTELLFRGVDGVTMNRGTLPVSTRALPQRVVVRHPWGILQYRQAEAPQVVN